MNPSYVSGLFSKTVGLPLKRYLTQLRLERAKELLGDPRKHITDVAYSVGYADANRFRHVFREWTGLSPTTWRETLRVNPPPVTLG